MLNNSKALGLAMMAACVVSAVGASAASAQTFEVELDGVASGFLTATSTDEEFTAGSSSVTCDHAEFSGAVESPTTELLVTPKYTACTAFGIANTHVLVTGPCHWRYVVKNTPTPPQTDIDSELLCTGTEGSHLVLTPTIFGGSVCTITFGTQKVSGSAPLQWLTAPNPDDLQVGPASLGGGNVAYTVTKSGFGCPSAGNHADGTYHISQTTVRAFSDASHTKQVGVKLVTK